MKCIQCTSYGPIEDGACSSYGEAAPPAATGDELVPGKQALRGRSICVRPSVSFDSAKYLLRMCIFIVCFAASRRSTIGMTWKPNTPITAHKQGVGAVCYKVLLVGDQEARRGLAVTLPWFCQLSADRSDRATSGQIIVAVKSRRSYLSLLCIEL